MIAKEDQFRQRAIQQVQTDGNRPLRHGQPSLTKLYRPDHALPDNRYKKDSRRHILLIKRGSGPADQLIHREAADGTEALTFPAPASYTTMLFGSSKLKMGIVYSVYTGRSFTAGIDFKGLYLSGAYSGGTKETSFTTTSIVTKVGGASE